MAEVAEPITSDMMELEIIARVLARVVRFIMTTTEMSGQKSLSIIGNDSYSVLVLDSVAQLLEGVCGKDLTEYIRKRVCDIRDKENK